MAITDYIPNVFGSATPTTYEGLLGMGLITPEQLAQTKSTANIQGLLGAGLALAQGMSKIGPRRSAAENILGALSGGFGAAGGAYQQGLQNIVQQQQLQSAALTQQQAANRLKAIQQAAQQNPQLAQLFAINPEEATKQMLAMERAKMYGFGPDGQTTQAITQATSAMPTDGATQVPMTADGGQVQPQVKPMVDPANVAKANEFRRKAALAMSLGDKDTATFFQNEADRLDPKEQLFFRDDKLVSSKRGIIGDFSGGKILTDEQATALGLDPARGKWTMKGGIPSLVTGTSKTRILTPEEVAQFNLSPDLTYQMSPEGQITSVTKTESVRNLSPEEVKAQNLNPNLLYQVDKTGKITQVSGSGFSKMLSKDEATKLGLPTNRNQVYQVDQNGKIDLVQGTAEDKEKFSGEYANLALAMFGTSDISKLSPEERNKVDSEAEKRGISKAKAGASTIYTGQLSKTTVGDVEKGVITTADAVTRLNNIQFSYKPQYQNIAFRSKQAWNTVRDKFGGLPDAEKRQLAEYSQYRQNALQNLNQTIKDITGAAMGVQEAERIIATLPNAGSDIFSGDSPTEFEAKLNNAIGQTKYALARKNYALRKGLNWEATPLDKMPNIINSRGAEIAKQYNLDPKKPADLQTINRQLAAEFGVSF